MGNSMRCCLACLPPGGAVNHIRIVHINGQIDQYSYPVTASDIITTNPNHVLSRSCSDPTATSRGNMAAVPPELELKSGQVYFLIPSPPDRTLKKTSNINQKGLISDYQNNFRWKLRKSGRVGVWRQQLDSIIEENQ